MPTLDVFNINFQEKLHKLQNCVSRQ